MTQNHTKKMQEYAREQFTMMQPAPSMPMVLSVRREGMSEHDYRPAELDDIIAFTNNIITETEKKEREYIAKIRRMNGG